MKKTDEAIKTAKTAEKTEADKKAHQKAIRDKNNAEMKAAKKVVTLFQETDEFKALSEDVKAALKRICGKTRAAVASKDSFADTLAAMFAKVGDSVAELDIFLKTKMGRSEFRKRVRESLKKAEKSARQWVEFDEDTESWTLLGTGEKMPKGFKGKAIDKVEKTEDKKAA